MCCMAHRLFQNEKIRYLLAGIFNTIIDFSLLNIIVSSLQFYPVVANTISVSVGITISYFLNHYFVFARKDGVSLKKYLIFFCVTGFSAIILQGLIIFGLEHLFVSSWWQSIYLVGDLLSNNETLALNAAKVAAVAVSMVWNFLLYKYVVFKKQPEETLMDIDKTLQD